MSSGIFQKPPKPKTSLGYYRMLSPNAAVRVSPLCLGAMNFGGEWAEYLGECSKDTAFEMLDFFYDNGGNFIDTANNYQRGESERWLGEWMEKRQLRDQMVIATKFTTAYRMGHAEEEIIVNTGGNGTKSLHLSLEQSLKNLKTSYIDLLYIHWWDFNTSIPELMQSLNATVLSGKVLYLGVSDTPAWVVSKANQYARDHGLRQFSVYQGHWSAALRDVERDIIPMCIDEGMSLAPWGALGGGKFKSEEQRKGNDGRVVQVPDAWINTSKVLEKIADRKKTLITSVALAYVMHKTPNVFPIVGGRKVEHLKGNIEALNLELTEEDIVEIEGANTFELGFPFGMIGTDAQSNVLSAYAGNVQYVERPKPIQPPK